MKGNFYTLGYAGVLGMICALLLTGASNFTAPYRKANADAERKRNILNVLQVPYPENASSEKLVEIFKKNVQQEKAGNLELYRYSPEHDSNSAGVLAVSFEGPGLWGPIKGFMALEQETIRGLTFYEQEETPGLGGEIASAWFREQFIGKQIEDKTGKAGVIIKGGTGENAVNEVDAISGATMTCDKVQAILNSVIEDVVKEKQENGS
jgi:Na+-transporting NADH:ubiquinone oxidoreductase subunit C